MFERHKIAERLRAHAEICDVAADLYSNEPIAADLERLAQACRQIASTVIKDDPKVWMH